MPDKGSAEAIAVVAARLKVQEAIDLMGKAAATHAQARSQQERMEAQDNMIIANMVMNRALIDMNMAHHDFNTMMFGRMLALMGD